MFFMPLMNNIFVKFTPITIFYTTLYFLIYVKLLKDV